MNKVLSIALLLALLGGSVQAQTQAAAGAVAPAPALAAGVQSQNIMDVKPDASNDPGYAKQTNGEREKVQPGNNAPMWRQVGAGATGYSSLTTPEAGNLIQPFVQYPGSRLTNAGDAWRQVRNNWIIPYGGAALLIVLGAIAVFYWRKGSMVLHPLGQRHCLLHSRGIGFGDGLWQVCHLAGDRCHPVRLAQLCPEKCAQFCGACIRGVAGGGDRHLCAGQPAQG